MVNNIVLLLLSFMTHVGGQMQLEPENLAVLRGEEARLTCSTSSQWTVMVWLLNDASVLTVSSEHGMLPSNNPNITTEDRSTPRQASWVFVLRGAERRHQGKVTCDLQNIKRKTANLYVQEKGSIEVSGGNRTVLKGKWVLFECKAAEWYPDPSLGWLVNGIEVAQSEYNISSDVSAEGLYTVTSDLSLEAAESSRVECLASVSALAKPLSSGVRLTVVAEVTPTGDNCTVLLTLTAALSSLNLLLFLLLSACIVLWYRRRRHTKSSKRHDIRFNQSVSRQSSVAEAAAGKVNLGYCAEVLPEAGHNDFITESHSRTESVCVHKVPDVDSSSSPSLHSPHQAMIDLVEERSKCHVRRVTTV